MNLDTLLIYCFVSFFYIISPGPAIFLAIYNGAANEFNSVLASSLGNIIGLIILSVISITGLSAILLASSSLFMMIKVIGAIYLIYLGIKQVRSSNKTWTTNTQLDKKFSSLFSYFREGLIVAVTNPKPIIFFAALFPQFLDDKEPLFLQFSVMTIIFVIFSFMSLSTYGYLAGMAKGFLSNSNKSKWFHRISGGLLASMGLSFFYIKSPN